MHKAAHCRHAHSCGLPWLDVLIPRHFGLSMQEPSTSISQAQLQYWTDERGRQYKGTSGGLAIQFGACKDSQTAADTAGLSADRTSTGAATFLFIQAVERLSKHHQALTCAAAHLPALVSLCCPSRYSNQCAIAQSWVLL